MQEIGLKRLRKLTEANIDMKKRVLHLPLKKIYFEEIKSGVKLFEYREITDYWQKRLVDREYEEIHIKSGYPRSDDKDRIIVRPWKGFEKQTIKHPHFGDKEIDVFAIVVN